MKKTIFALALLYIATSAFAKKDDSSNKNEKVLCVVICSPCKEVSNTHYTYMPSDEQIKKDQERMRKECDEIAKSKM